MTMHEPMNAKISIFITLIFVSVSSSSFSSFASVLCFLFTLYIDFLFFSTYFYYLSPRNSLLPCSSSAYHSCIFFGRFRFQILAQKTVHTDSCHLISITHPPFKFSSITFSYVKSAPFLMFSSLGLTDDSNLSY